MASAREALARGDVLIAYDEARAILMDEPENLAARYLASLALVRSGATERAIQSTQDLRSLISRSSDVPLQLQQDADALLARLAKDRALSTSNRDRPQLAAEAADRYEQVGERYGGHYPYINAATLRLLAGDLARARELAARALSATDDESDEYWRLATEAEASLIREDYGRAQQALKRVEERGLGDMATRARTRRQLALVCHATRQDISILNSLIVPSVLHYCGHLAVSNDIRPAVDDFLRRQHVGIAYGSLARGADIVIAEWLLKRGIELHVVLPFGIDDFEASSVESDNSEWRYRYRSCLEQATSTTVASDSAYLDDRGLFGYSSRIAMGHAINRARFLGVEVEQLAVWDGLPALAPEGTAHDVDIWQRAGRH